MNAFIATAASMLKDGESPDHVRSTLGLSEEEMTAASRHVPPAASRTVVVPPGPAHPAAVLEATTDTNPVSTRPVPALPAIDASASAGSAIPEKREIAALLAWAQKHPAAAVRAKAARIRADLAELHGRQAADAAQREAEQRVADLKAQLEQAQADLRTVKTGGRPSAVAKPSVPAKRPASAGSSAASRVPAVAGAARRSARQWGEIRRWARQNGHQVADQGTIRKAVVDAYDAAHTTEKAAG